jgi:hypothetical protein
MKTPLRFVGIATLLVMTSGVAAAQSAGAGSVEGVVVRLGNGEPITGVNVEMRRVEGTAAAPLGPPVFATGYTSPGAVVVPSSPNPADIFRARTGNNGRFVFTNLRPGKYRLLAAHPRGAYYPAEYGQRHPRGPGYDFVLDETQPMRVGLEMAPMAAVSGRVLGADGRPAPRAGRFRIQGVAPGSYLAFAWPWLPNAIWQYPEFIRTFEARGKLVNIVEGPNGNLELMLLPELNF